MALYRKKFNLWRPKVLTVLGLIFLLFIIVGIVREIINRYRIDRQISDLQLQVDKVGKENIELSSLIENWSKSSEMEEQARLKLGLQKPGEKAVLIVKNNNASSFEPQPLGNNPEIVGHIVKDRGELPDTVSNPQKWWQYFFPKKS